MRYIPQPEAQERYLAGAVGAVLEQAHGRILRMLQQADVFKDITSYNWLPRVGASVSMLQKLLIMTLYDIQCLFKTIVHLTFLFLYNMVNVIF